MLPGPLKDAVDVWMWKRCYSMQEVNSALSKVQLVGYSQKVVRIDYVQEIFKISHFCFRATVTSPRLFSRLFFLQELFGAVQVSPLSSGYSLGSSNWIIQSHHEKVSYVSGSSLLTTHPQVGQQAECFTISKSTGRNP